MLANSPQPQRSSLQAPRLVLLLTLIFTALAAWLVSLTSHDRQRENFGRDAEIVRLQIVSRLETYVNLLRGGASFFSASETVSRAEFSTYVSRLRIDEFYPGIQGIAYAERVLPAEQDAVVARVRAEGFEQFAIRPAGAREEYLPVIYLEPMNARNRAAIGFDMRTEAVRNAAMEAARDSALPVASGPVTLMQEIESRKQPGFLIYVPIYLGGEVPADVEGRRRALRGYVSAPFRAHDLFDAVRASIPFEELGFEVFDGASLAPERLLFAAQQRAGVPARLSRVSSIAVAGHVWTLRFQGDVPLGLAAPHVIVPFVAGSGLALGLALFAATRRLVAAREAAERSAREAEHSRRLFERIAAATPDVLSVFDLVEGNTVYVNREVSKALGFTPEQIHSLGPRWLPELVHPDDQARAREQLARFAALPDGAVQMSELRFRHADGGYRWLLSRSVVFHRLADGRAHEMLGISTDITERRATEEALRAANEAKDHFLAALSHELRTPLTPVLAVVSGLEADARLDAEVRAELAMVRRNIELEARLIDDLLDLTRVTHGKLLLHLAPVEVRELVQHCVATVTELRGKSIDFTLEWRAEHGWVSGDHSRLTQVFWNLLKNAAKFTGAGGRVTVRAFNENGAGADALPALVLECEDAGIGIEPDVLPQIFTAFEQGGRGVTRQFGGLGLGLAISRAIVEAHGGSIAARSAGAGRGATFAVRLPTVPAPEIVPQTPPEPRALLDSSPAENGGTGGGLHILLVEDHADTAEILVRRLRRLGHTVTHADTVASALATTARAQAGSDGERIDLLVSDLGLPDGTGLDLMRQLAAAHGLPGIAVSGFGMESDLRQSAEAGFARHFTKPVDFAQLARAIEELGAVRKPV